MAIEAIILGLDDVLFDTEDAHLHACNAAFEICGLTLHWTLPQLRKAMRLRGATNAVIAAVDGIAPSRGVDTRRLVQEKNRIYREILAALRPAPHAACMKLVDDALEKGCKLAVATDMPAPTATTLLDLAFDDAATSIFAAVVSGADFSEPAANGPHALALRTVGADVRNCVAIHVATPALEAAQRAGLWTVSVTPYEKDVARVTGADLWCPQFQELRHLLGRPSARSAQTQQLQQLQQQQPQRFITFEALQALQANRTRDTAAPDQRMRYRQSA